MTRKPITLLMIEDNDDDVQLFRARWAQRYPEDQIVLAATYAQTEAIFKDDPQFKLIFLDLHLPDDQTGLRTFRLCRERASETLLVCITGEFEEFHHRLFQSVGGVYLCRKGAASLDLQPIFNLLS